LKHSPQELIASFVPHNPDTHSNNTKNHAPHNPSDQRATLRQRDIEGLRHRPNGPKLVPHWPTQNVSVDIQRETNHTRPSSQVVATLGHPTKNPTRLTSACFVNPGSVVFRYIEFSVAGTGFEPATSRLSSEYCWRKSSQGMLGPLTTFFGLASIPNNSLASSTAFCRCVSCSSLVPVEIRTSRPSIGQRWRS